MFIYHKIFFRKCFFIGLGLSNFKVTKLSSFDVFILFEAC